MVLRDKNNNPVFTPDQVRSLRSLTLITGRPVLVAGPIMYQFIVFALQNGATKTMDWIQSNEIIGEPGKTVWKTHEEILWDSPSLESAREKFAIDIEIFKNKSAVTEGLFECPRCHSKKTIVSERQARSADEPTNITVTCDACRKQWRVQ